MESYMFVKEMAIFRHSFMTSTFLHGKKDKRDNARVRRRKRRPFHDLPPVPHLFHVVERLRRGLRIGFSGCEGNGRWECRATVSGRLAFFI